MSKNNKSEIIRQDSFVPPKAFVEKKSVEKKSFVPPKAVVSQNQNSSTVNQNSGNSSQNSQNNQNGKK